MHNNRLEGCSAWAIDIAIGKGHLEVVKWLYFNTNKICNYYTAFRSAISGGQLHVLLWLHEQMKEQFEIFYPSLAKNDKIYRSNIEVLQFMKNYKLENACKSPTSSYLDPTHAIDIAAEAGLLQVLEWLHENYPEAVCTTYAMDYAAKLVTTWSCTCTQLAASQVSGSRVY